MTEKEKQRVNEIGLRLSKITPELEAETSLDFIANAPSDMAFLLRLAKRLADREDS